MRIDTVSPTRLKIAEKCEFKYLLSYIWGFSDELFQYTFASEFGTSIHDTLEAYAKSKGKLDFKKRYFRNTLKYKTYHKDMMKAPSKARILFFSDKKCDTCQFLKDNKCILINKEINTFDGCPLSLYNDGLKILEKAINRYDIYFKTGLKSKDNPSGKIIGIEQPANIIWGTDYEGKDIVMNGYIDLLVEYDNETLMVIDYKTGFSVPSYDEFIEDLQPRMYSFAAKHIFPNYRYYLVQFDYFRSQNPIEHVFTDSDDEKTRQQVIELYNKIKSAKTIKRRAEDSYCSYMCNRPLCDRKWEELKNGVDGTNLNKIKNSIDKDD